MALVILDGYVIAVETAMAVGIRKIDNPDSELKWLARSLLQDGDVLHRGDTDIETFENIAHEKELDF